MRRKQREHKVTQVNRERGVQATTAHILLYSPILLLNVSTVSAHRRPYNTQQRKVLMLGEGSGQGRGELTAITVSRLLHRAQPCHGAQSRMLGGGMLPPQRSSGAGNCDGNPCQGEGRGRGGGRRSHSYPQQMQPWISRSCPRLTPTSCKGLVQLSQRVLWGWRTSLSYAAGTLREQGSPFSHIPLAWEQPCTVLGVWKHSGVISRYKQNAGSECKAEGFALGHSNALEPPWPLSSSPKTTASAC